MKARDVIERKAGGPALIDASQTVAEAIRRLCDRRVRALVVADSGRLVGVADSGTILSRLDEVGGAALDEKVAELPIERAVTVGPDALLSDVGGLFQKERVNHVVVVADGKVDGVLTRVEVLRRLLDHVEFLNEQMRDYVSTAGYVESDDDSSPNAREEGACG